MIWIIFLFTNLNQHDTNQDTERFTFLFYAHYAFFFKCFKYLCKWRVLKLFLMLEEDVQTILFHNDLRLVREQDRVAVKGHP